MAAADTDLLEVTALAAPETRGSALAGMPGCSLVVTVSSRDGRPVPGLSAEQFSVTGVAPSQSPARAIPLDESTESAPGVYVLRLSHGTISRASSRQIACVIDVQTSGASPGRGRALARIDVC